MKGPVVEIENIMDVDEENVVLADVNHVNNSASFNSHDTADDIESNSAQNTNDNDDNSNDIHESTNQNLEETSSVNIPGSLSNLPFHSNKLTVHITIMLFTL